MNEQRGTAALAEIRQLLHEQLPKLRSQYGVRAMWLFGSYVHGEQDRSSDLDVLVQFDDRPLSLLEFIALQNYLSDLLEVKVDLVERETLKPAIGRQVISAMVPV